MTTNAALALSSAEVDAATLSIVEVATTDKKRLKQFIAFPRTIYPKDSAWVSPLDLERQMAFDRKKNPFFQHADAAFFLCVRKDAQGNETIVGRISAQIDHEHTRIHNDGAGFYGNFDAIDDARVAKILFDTAEAWLKAKGMKIMRGPYTMNINEECGVQVDAYDEIPMFLTAYNIPYYKTLVEGAGFHKVKELYSWRYRKEYVVPESAKRIGDRARSNPKIKVRPIDMKNFEVELRTGLGIFNAAWKDNWGFVPLTEPEMKKAAEDLKLIIDPRIILIAEYEGKPAGMALTVPNINEVIRPLRGKMFPFGWVSLLWNTKVKRPKRCRLTLLGVHPDFRGIRAGGGLAIALCQEVFERCVAAGYEEAELSWTLDDNVGINNVIKAMGGQLYKTHYVYDRAIA
ncbi:MAG: GNAT family N-acetyltransferase [Deltaproteobacteria bacterium]|nr:GNAT family N-acetyltransferase [Deltaproteobacteria bacterium]